MHCLPVRRSFVQSFVRWLVVCLWPRQPHNNATTQQRIDATNNNTSLHSCVRSIAVVDVVVVVALRCVALCCCRCIAAVALPLQSLCCCCCCCCRCCNVATLRCVSREGGTCLRLSFVWSSNFFVVVNCGWNALCLQVEWNWVSHVLNLIGAVEGVGGVARISGQTCGSQRIAVLDRTWSLVSECQARERTQHEFMHMLNDS